MAKPTSPGYMSGKPDDSNVDPAFLDKLFADPTNLISTLRAAYTEWDSYSRNLAGYVVGTKAGDTNSLDGLAYNLSPSPNSGWYGTAADEFGKQVKSVRDFGLITAANGSSNTKSGDLQAYYQTLMSSDEAYQNPDFYGILIEIESVLNDCQSLHGELVNSVSVWAERAVNTWFAVAEADSAWDSSKPYTVPVPGLVQIAAGTKQKPSDFLKADPNLPTSAGNSALLTLTGSSNVFDETATILYVDHLTGDHLTGTQGAVFGEQAGGDNLKNCLIAKMKAPSATGSATTAFGPSYTRLLRAILVPLTTLYTKLGDSLPQAVSDKSLPVLGGQGNNGNNGNGGGGGGGLPRTGPATPPPKLATGPATNTPKTGPATTPQPKTGAASGPAGGASGMPKTGAATVPSPYKPTTGSAGHTPPADLNAYKPLTGLANGSGLGGSGKLAAFDPATGLAGGSGLGPGGLGGTGLAGPGGGLDAGGANGLGGPGAGLGAGAAGAAGAGAGAAGMAGRGMPMRPMGAGAGGGKESKERQRKAFLTEDDDVWGADGGEPPAVL